MSLLDNAYTNIAQCGDICSSGILTTNFSDHYSIFSITTFTLDKVKPVFIRIIEFSDSNKTRFHNALKFYCKNNGKKLKEAYAGPFVCEISTWF